LFHRRVLLGLLAGACALAFPAVAAAAINPNLVISPSGPAGATGQTVAYNLSFSASPAGDSPATIINHFPAGMLADSTINNDQCLASTNYTAACQIANGTVTVIEGVTPTPLPAAEYLVPAPNPATDVAGVQLMVNAGSGFVPSGPPADVTVRPNDAGLDVKFSDIPGPTNGAQPPISDIQLNLTDERLPSSCAAETMTVNTVSEAGSNETSNAAPYQSTGCPAQAYNPQVSANVTAVGNGGADVSAAISQAADEAASQSIELDLPSSLQPNLFADIGCFSQPNGCLIGNASALTPLAPPQALANGTVTLGGSVSAPTITVAFPAPYALSFTGAVNIGNNTVLVSGIPDVPITSLKLNITHSQFGEAFTTSCAASTLVAKFHGQGGQSSTVNAPVNYGTSCQPSVTVGKPAGTASVKGLSSGKPVLHVHVTHGSNAPNVSSVAITVGSGLKFSKKAFVKKCTGHGHHKKCTTKVKGLSVTGGKIKKVVLHGSGRIVITFTHAVSAASITMRSPLLTESKGLQKKAKKHKVKSVKVVLKVTDAKGTRTTITLKAKA
jgi:hypothetical protein